MSETIQKIIVEKVLELIYPLCLSSTNYGFYFSRGLSLKHEKTKDTVPAVKNHDVSGWSGGGGRI